MNGTPRLVDSKAARLPQAAGRWATFACAFVLSWTIVPSRARADEKTVVPSVDDRWRERFVAGLERIGSGDLSGLAIVEEALQSERGTLVALPASRPSTLADLHAALVALGSGRDDPLTRRFALPRILAAWCLEVAPPEVIAAFRERTKGTVSHFLAAYEESGDPRLLERAGRDLVFADGAAAAAERLADERFEAGSHRVATLSFLDILALPDVPADVAERSASKAIIASAHVRDGFLDRHVREVVTQRFAGSKLVANALAAAKRIAASDPRPVAAPSSWGGELFASSLPKLPADRLELTWQSFAWGDGESMVRPDVRLPPGRLQRRQFAPGVGFNLMSVDYPFVPLVEDDGRMWIAGVYNLYAIASEPGTGRVLRELPKPDPERLRATKMWRERSESPVYAVTRWRRDDDHLGTGRGALTRMSRLPEEVLITHYGADLVPAVQFYGHYVTQEIAVRALVAYDAETGDLLWRTEPRDAVAEEEKREPRRQAPRQNPRRIDPRWNLPGGQIDGGSYAPTEIPADFCVSSPAVVRGGRVYVGGWSEEGFVHAHVRAIDVETGATIWQTHVASSSLESTLFGEIAREPFASFLVERDGVLYFQSNLGAVAALDAESGRLLWVTTYDTIRVPIPDSAIPELRDLVWSARPPLLLGHVLIAAPRDSYYLLAIDTGTGPGGTENAGRILWSYRNEDGDLRDLLGFARERLYFTGRAGVGYLDLAKLGINGSLEGGGDAIDERARPRPEPRKVLTREVWRRGSVPAAGALCDRGVVLADENGLWLFDLDLAEAKPLLAGEVPRSPHGEFPGRVTVHDGLVLVTSNGLLSAFAPVPSTQNP